MKEVKASFDINGGSNACGSQVTQPAASVP